MRFFQYKAMDSAGKQAEGTIRAATVDAARSALSQAGYRVTFIGEAAAAVANPIAQTMAKSAPRVATAPAVAPRSAPQVSRPAIAVAQTANAAVAGQVKTKWGTDKQLYFLFSQLGQYFRAGIAPQAAFHNLANQAKPHFLEALRDVERNATEGKRISDILERYPYLFPPDVVGVTRAGEASGYLGEAFENISVQVEGSARIKRRLSYFVYLFAIIVGLFPVLYSIVTGSVESIRAQDQAGGTLSPVGTLVSKTGIALSAQAIPTGVGIALFIGVMLWWHSMPMRRTRHRLVLAMPALGARVKAEAMERFTWALALISRGGVSPQTSFAIAATCVPNLILRDRLIAAANTMMESERLSVALQRSEALPVEYTHIVQTGEMTGDVPRALADIHRATEAELKAREGTTVTVSSLLFYVALSVIVLGMLVFLYKTLVIGEISAISTDG